MHHTALAATAIIGLLGAGVNAEPTNVRLVERELPPVELGTRIAWYDSVAFRRDRVQLAVMFHEKPWALSTKRTAFARWCEIGDELGRWHEEKVGTFGDVYACHGSSVGAIFSAEGRLLALSPHWNPAPPQLAITDAISGVPVQQFIHDSKMKVISYCFSADCKFAAVCCTRLTRAPEGDSPTPQTESGEVDVWDLGTGKRRFQHRVDMGGCYKVAFSPDSKLIAVASGAYHGMSPTGTIQLFEVESGQEKYVLISGGDPVDCVAFSPDGNTTVAGVDHCVLKSWDVATGREKGLTYLGKQLRPWFVSCLAYSPDGKILAVALGNRNRGQKGGEVRLLDAMSMKTIATPLEAAQNPLTCVAFSADGTLLAACGGDTLMLWDLVCD